MHDLTDDEEKQILGDVLKHKLDAIAENMASGAEMNRRFNAVDERLGTIEQRLGAVELAVKDQSKQFADHEGRLVRIEDAA